MKRLKSAAGYVSELMDRDAFTIKPFAIFFENGDGRGWGLALPEFPGDFCDIFLCFAGF